MNLCIDDECNKFKKIQSKILKIKGNNINSNSIDCLMICEINYIACMAERKKS
jgi:hypothetical protein